jgi:excisionase family DNA binding protein
VSYRVELPDDVFEALAHRVAEILRDRFPEQTPSLAEFLTVREAAELLRAKPQRVYDLVSAGRLTRYRDGSRVLLARAELDAHLRGVDPQMIHPAASCMHKGIRR